MHINFPFLSHMAIMTLLWRTQQKRCKIQEGAVMGLLARLGVLT